MPVLKNYILEIRLRCLTSVTEIVERLDVEYGKYPDILEKYSELPHDEIPLEVYEDAFLWAKLKYVDGRGLMLRTKYGMWLVSDLSTLLAHAYKYSRDRTLDNYKT